MDSSQPAITRADIADIFGVPPELILEPDEIGLTKPEPDLDDLEPDVVGTIERHIECARCGHRAWIFRGAESGYELGKWVRRCILDRCEHDLGGRVPVGGHWSDYGWHYHCTARGCECPDCTTDQP